MSRKYWLPSTLLLLDWSIFKKVNVFVVNLSTLIECFSNSFRLFTGVVYSELDAGNDVAKIKIVGWKGGGEEQETRRIEATWFSK